MKATLHLRAEYGEVRIHPGYDVRELERLTAAWREAKFNPASTLTDELAAEEALAEYLRLDLDVVAAHGLAEELQDAGVYARPF